MLESVTSALLFHLESNFVVQLKVNVNIRAYFTQSGQLISLQSGHILTGERNSLQGLASLAS